MSRSSQKSYLDRLLEPPGVADAAEPVPPPHPASGIGSPLLTRTNSLERIASGELKQVTQIRVDPNRCRIWSGNARDYASLTEDRCRDLIDSMIAEGGQRVPALVRRLKNDSAHEYEVIYGTRRHWATSWLRAHNYPDFLFLAEVRDIDDEAAFRLADLENRARADISEIERARNYAAALPRHYDGKQSTMAERLNISKGLLSKMIAFAGVSDKIFSAFAAPGELSLRQGYALAQAVSAPPAETRAARAAGVIARENAALRDEGRAPLPTNTVLARILQAASGASSIAPGLRQAFFRGKPVVTILDENRNGVRLQLHTGTGADLQAILASVGEVLEHSSLGTEKHD